MSIASTLTNTDLHPVGRTTMETVGMETVGMETVGMETVGL